MDETVALDFIAVVVSKENEMVGLRKTHQGWGYSVWAPFG
jgi:hypothetical protein